MTNFGLITGYYKPLSLKQVETIHEASMSVLEEVGFQVDHQRALEVFSARGCTVNFDTKNVKVSKQLAMEYIKKAPSRVCLYSRDGKNDILIEPGRSFFSTGGAAIKIYDFSSKEVRKTTVQDVGLMAKVADQLENIHICMLSCFPTEISKEEVDVNRFFAGLNNTSKHVIGGAFGPGGARKVIKMAQVIADGEHNLREKPFISMICCQLSPLRMEKNYVEYMFDIIEAGVPLIISVCPTSGMTAPMTLAGQLVQLNVEALIGVMFSQMVCQGTPVFYGSAPTVADMRFGQFVWGAIECGIMGAASTQLAAFYNLPLYSTAGITDSKTTDIQAGIEKAMSSLLLALAGGQLIHNSAGLLDGSMVCSPVQLVIDNEINGMALRAVKGIEVTSDTLATEVIKKVGPGGNFLAEDHTIEYMRSEVYFPRLANRMTYADWVKSGTKNLVDHAEKIVENILRNDESQCLDIEIIKALKEEFPELRLN